MGLRHLASLPPPAHPPHFPAPRRPAAAAAAAAQDDGMMDALTWEGRESIALRRVPRPTLQAPGDALVRVELAGLCGSDLHPYFCRERGLDPGTVQGHEFVVRRGG